MDNFPNDVEPVFENLEDLSESRVGYDFHQSNSVVFSSKIEGEEIELDSYIKHRLLGVSFKPDYTKRADDLYEAYSLAFSSKLSESNALKAHALISKSLLPKSQRGVYRNAPMMIVDNDGRIVYEACDTASLKNEMQLFWEDVELLLSTKMVFEESLFFAAMIHLYWVKIHPLTDGNGRMGRLIEKWFLFEKLGEKAKMIHSERYYFENKVVYYSTLTALGLFYEKTAFNEAIKFLELLTNAIKAKK